jgi:hypothetical protein
MNGSRENGAEQHNLECPAHDSEWSIDGNVLDGTGEAGAPTAPCHGLSDNSIQDRSTLQASYLQDFHDIPLPATAELESAEALQGNWLAELDGFLSSACFRDSQSGGSQSELNPSVEDATKTGLRQSEAIQRTAGASQHAVHALSPKGSPTDVCRTLPHAVTAHSACSTHVPTNGQTTKQALDLRLWLLGHRSNGKAKVPTCPTMSGGVPPITSASRSSGSCRPTKSSALKASIGPDKTCKQRQHTDDSNWAVFGNAGSTNDKPRHTSLHSRQTKTLAGNSSLQVRRDSGGSKGSNLPNFSTCKENTNVDTLLFPLEHASGSPDNLGHARIALHPKSLHCNESECHGAGMDLLADLSTDQTLPEEKSAYALEMMFEPSAIGSACEKRKLLLPCKSAPVDKANTIDTGSFEVLESALAVKASDPLLEDSKVEAGPPNPRPTSMLAEPMHTAQLVGSDQGNDFDDPSVQPLGVGLHTLEALDPSRSRSQQIGTKLVTGEEQTVALCTSLHREQGARNVGPLSPGGNQLTDKVATGSTTAQTEAAIVHSEIGIVHEANKLASRHPATGDVSSKLALMNGPGGRISAEMEANSRQVAGAAARLDMCPDVECAEPLAVATSGVTWPIADQDQRDGDNIKLDTCLQTRPQASGCEAITEKPPGCSQKAHRPDTGTPHPPAVSNTFESVQTCTPDLCPLLSSSYAVASISNGSQPEKHHLFGDQADGLFPTPVGLNTKDIHAMLEHIISTPSCSSFCHLLSAVKDAEPQEDRVPSGVLRISHSRADLPGLAEVSECHDPLSARHENDQKQFDRASCKLLRHQTRDFGLFSPHLTPCPRIQPEAHQLDLHTDGGTAIQTPDLSPLLDTARVTCSPLHRIATEFKEMGGLDAAAYRLPLPCEDQGDSNRMPVLAADRRSCRCNRFDDATQDAEILASVWSEKRIPARSRKNFATLQESHALASSPRGYRLSKTAQNGLPPDQQQVCHDSNADDEECQSDGSEDDKSECHMRPPTFTRAERWLRRQALRNELEVSEPKTAEHHHVQGSPGSQRRKGKRSPVAALEIDSNVSNANVKKSRTGTDIHEPLQLEMKPSLHSSHCGILFQQGSKAVPVQELPDTVPAHGYLSKAAKSKGRRGKQQEHRGCKTRKVSKTSSTWNAEGSEDDRDALDGGIFTKCPPNRAERMSRRQSNMHEAAGAPEGAKGIASAVGANVPKKANETAAGCHLHEEYGCLPNLDVSIEGGELLSICEERHANVLFDDETSSQLSKANMLFKVGSSSRLSKDAAQMQKGLCKRRRPGEIVCAEDSGVSSDREQKDCLNRDENCSMMMNARVRCNSLHEDEHTRFNK